MAKGVKHLILIGDNDCGMAKVPQVASEVIDAFVDQGWRREVAEEYVRKQGSRHAILVMSSAPSKTNTFACAKSSPN